MKKIVNRAVRQSPVESEPIRAKFQADLKRTYSSRVYTYVRKAGQTSLQKIQKEPLCLKILKNFYHKYGLKHLVLIFTLFVYCCFGALIFVLIEEPHQNWMKSSWKSNIASKRSAFVNHLMKDLFNNSRFLIFIRHRTSKEVNGFLQEEFSRYEKQLNIKYSEMKMEWDYWNAMLYAGTIFTTIGYGHIYPHTSAGKILTMIYAIFGIPLVLLILQDLGKLLTVSLKFPWFQLKRATRRILRCCTKQSMEEIWKIEKQEEDNLSIFDLPIPVAIGLVVGWIFLCSATFCIWETQWSYLEAFYFFFISLSTVGLGDLVLQKPRMLLMMFGMIFIGLSLVSMCINVIQVNLEATYETGNKKYVPGSSNSSRRTSEANNSRRPSRCLPTIPEAVVQIPKRTILGVFATGDQSPTELRHKRSSRSSQTHLSYPAIGKIAVNSDGSVQWLSSISSYSFPAEERSPDDVTQLVESETDCRVLSDLAEEYSEETEEMKLVAQSQTPPTTPPRVLVAAIYGTNGNENDVVAL